MECPTCGKESEMDKFGSWYCCECETSELDYLRTQVSEWKHRAIGGTCRTLSDPDCDCSLCKRDAQIARLQAIVDNTEAAARAALESEEEK